MRYLRFSLLGLFLVLVWPFHVLAQTTQAIQLPVQDFTWSVTWLPGGVPTTPHHYDLVCNKTGATTLIRKPLANPPAEVSFVTLFTATDVGVYTCWAEAMTSTNTLIARSTKADGTNQNVGFEVFVESIAPNRLEMKFRVR